ncbi:MAG TPA: hypothetical protein ENG59_04320 [Chloroflexi bacterium]|nr:MAG: hypothetical protein DRI46_04735 [Chloroflexota bacterium]HDD55446.1 hypothetical protein [Chloroflexota bacterium]
MLDKTFRKKACLLLARLERISADSPWAHQASGVRASLAKHLASENCTLDEIENLVNSGYRILEKAASEIPESAESSPTQKTGRGKS